MTRKPAQGIEKLRPRWLKPFINAAILILSLAVIVVVTFAWPLAFALLEPLKQIAIDPVWRLVLLGFVITIAWLLFYVRQLARTLYGIGEFCIGVTICWVFLSRAPNDTAGVTLGLIGGVYIIIRGLDNIAEGRKLTDEKSETSN
jgi:hypothetical protein